VTYEDRIQPQEGMKQYVNIVQGYETENGKRIVNVDNRHEGNWMESLLASRVRKLLRTGRQMAIKKVVIMCR